MNALLNEPGDRQAAIAVQQLEVLENVACAQRSVGDDQESIVLLLLGPGAPDGNLLLRAAYSPRSRTPALLL